MNSSKIDRSFMKGLKWRCIGPPRGGRTSAVVGHPTEQAVFYFGACGGGVWKSDDAGTYWENISDGYFTSAAVGAIAIADSDPNVIYVGTGETAIRKDVTGGDGVYRSDDGGKTWENMGLSDSRFIGKIRVHPLDSDIVYVAALGHIFGPNEERGVFRSHDGGKNWEKVLFKSAKAGAVDISMDPTNPRRLFASVWETSRTFWDLSSGGPDSGLYRSTDGGNTWTDISNNPGLPKGLLGKIGVAISPARPQRVWAIIEADNHQGGLYRSDDGGDTWQLMSDKRELIGRPFYYCHVYADPQDADTMYVLDFKVWKSTDGGSGFKEVTTPHGDNHDLWIDPRNTQRMIEGNDGGACVSLNGGRTWSSIYNQMTSQFYRIDVDNQFPYHVYATQQDNSSICVPSATEQGTITWSRCYTPGSGESGDIAVDPNDENIVYIGSIGSSPGGSGVLQSYDHRTKQYWLASVWPEEYFGRNDSDLKYRFNWTFPILISQHDPAVLYVAGNLVFRSTDGGMNWEAISPDLTRDDPEKQLVAGGPITIDASGAETYCTVYALAESPLQRGELWAGSDDGLVHISRDDGKNWTAVTPPELIEWSRVGCIEVSRHSSGTAYLAASRHKLDDFTGYIYKTEDFGKSWRVLSSGFPPGEISRVVREDPSRPGILYVGTESGVCVSLDDGDSWTKLESNLPVVPVYDLKVKDNDLVAGTHGRSFWILDDLTALRHLAEKRAGGGAQLFPPTPTYRRLVDWRAKDPRLAEPHDTNYLLTLGCTAAWREHESEDGELIRTFIDAGENPPLGVIVYYLLADEPAGEIGLSFLDADGVIIKSFSSKPAEEKEGKDDGADEDEEEQGTRFAPAKKGLNRFVWDMHYENAARSTEDSPIRGTYESLMKSRPGTNGPLAVPGRYQVQLTAGESVQSETFEILPDPRLEMTREDFQTQFDLLRSVRDKLSEANAAIDRLRRIQRQSLESSNRAKAKTAGERDGEAISKAARELNETLAIIEAELVQIEREGASDFVRAPVKLVDMLAGLISGIAMADAPPTTPMKQLFKHLSGLVDEQISQLQEVVDNDVAKFNERVRDAELPAISL
jgi:photosystem II stability/assembly factor-like uncharacterized protein